MPKRKAKRSVSPNPKKRIKKEDVSTILTLKWPLNHANFALLFHTNTFSVNLCELAVFHSLAVNTANKLQNGFKTLYLRHVNTSKVCYSGIC